MAHKCSWWQTHGLHRDEEDNLAEQLGLVGLIGQRSYCGLTPQPSLPVDVDATADPGPGWLSTSNHSAAVNMQNVPFAHKRHVAAAPSMQGFRSAPVSHL